MHNYHTGIRLDVDSPLAWVQIVSHKGTTLTQLLHLVDELIATIVTVTRVTLRVLICEA